MLDADLKISVRIQTESDRAYARYRAALRRTAHLGLDGLRLLDDLHAASLKEILPVWVRARGSDPLGERVK